MSCHYGYGHNHLGDAETCEACAKIGALVDVILGARREAKEISAKAGEAFNARFRELEREARGKEGGR